MKTTDEIEGRWEGRLWPISRYHTAFWNG